jgi:hypothetical protein
MASQKSSAAVSDAAMSEPFKEQDREQWHKQRFKWQHQREEGGTKRVNWRSKKARWLKQSS